MSRTSAAASPGRSRIAAGDEGFTFGPQANVILKVAGACNLNCDYCYVYNKADTSWRDRPARMTSAVRDVAVDRLVEFAVQQRLDRLVVALHGGEPLLLGRPWTDALLRRLRAETEGVVDLVVTLQTNGTLIDDRWIDLLSTHAVRVGVSFDGPPSWHDRHRVYHSGRGSYDRVRRALERLLARGDDVPEWGVLVVADPGCPGTEVYDHLRQIGVRRMDFLWPDHHHDDPPPWRRGALAEYFTDLFDRWFDGRDAGVHVRWFESVLTLLLGGAPRVDALGPQSITEIVVEADGSIEPLDVLRTCGDRFTATGLDVARAPLSRITETEVFQLGVRNQELLPHACLTCPVHRACGGGYLPHRYSRERGFANASVHCHDLLAVIGHVERRLEQELARA